VIIKNSQLLQGQGER